MALELPEEKTIDLRKPVEFGGQTYTALVLREPTAGELKRATDPDPMTSNIKLVSFVTGIPPQAVEKIGIRDLTDAVQFLAGFMPGDPKTGNQS